MNPNTTQQDVRSFYSTQTTQASKTEAVSSGKTEQPPTVTMSTPTQQIKMDSTPKTFNDLFTGYEGKFDGSNVTTFNVKDGVEWKEVDEFFKRNCAKDENDGHWKWRGWGFDRPTDRKVTLVLVGCAHWVCECSRKEMTSAYNTEALRKYLHLVIRS